LRIGQPPGTIRTKTAKWRADKTPIFGITLFLLLIDGVLLDAKCRSGNVNVQHVMFNTRMNVPDLEISILEIHAKTMNISLEARACHVMH
jgi:hypothetical protein